MGLRGNNRENGMSSLGDKSALQADLIHLRVTALL